MAKETVLNDDADIYKKRSDDTDHEQLRDMHGRRKWIQYKDYYLGKTIIAMIAVFVIGFIIYSLVKPRPDQIFYAAVINDRLDKDQKESMLSSFGEQIDYNKKKQSMSLDDSYVLDMEHPDDAMLQKISTYAYAQNVDVIIANEEVFKFYAENGFFADLSKVLSEDTMNALSSNIGKYALKDMSDGNGLKDNVVASGETYPFGICLNDSNAYTSISDSYQGKNEIPSYKMYIGIVNNTKHLDNCVDYINYLFELPKSEKKNDTSK